MSEIKPQGYRPRLVDAEIGRFLSLFGAIEIAGPKWCGKTWSARAHGASITYVDRNGMLDVAQADPSIVLEGIRPHVIDEWQLAPSIWDTVRHAVDEASQKGNWILTGSSTPKKGTIRHSGAGRIGRVRMRPMSLQESGDSSAVVSLAGLFEGRFQPQQVETSIRDVLTLSCRGGWPDALSVSPEDALLISREYLRAFIENTMPQRGRSRDISGRLLASLARNVCQAATYKTLQSDMAGGEKDASSLISIKTVTEYLAEFEALYLIDEVKGWAPPLRSRKRVQLKPKRYFADPSLAVAALGASPSSLIEDWQTLGLIFENLCLRDLLVYANALPGAAMTPVRYYRDDAGLETDVIIERADGSWAALEIKLSDNKVEEGVASLTRLCKKLQHNTSARVREPEFLAVVVGVSHYARKTPEGVYVVPITALGA
jgi:predicted AAA+ superfamily ATPase